MSSDSEVEENISDQRSEQSEQDENISETQATATANVTDAPVTWKDLVSFIFVKMFDL